MKKKVAATRMIAAAAETRIKVVVFDFAGCFGRDGTVALAASTEGSATGAAAAWGREACGFGEVFGVVAVVATAGGTLLAGTLSCGTMPVGTFAAGIGSGAASLGGSWLGEAGRGGTWFGGTSFTGTTFIGTTFGRTGLGGATELAGTWPVSATEGVGAFGRGT
jgi:hypothetical protein